METSIFGLKSLLIFNRNSGKKKKNSHFELKTHTEAKRLAHQASTRFDEKCQKLRKRIFSQNTDQETFILDSAVEQEICELWKFHTLDGDEWARQQGLFSDEYEEQSQARLETHDFLRQLLIHGDSEKILPALGQFLDLLGVNLSGDSESWQRLRYRFLQTMAETHALQLSRDNGEVVHTPKPPEKTKLSSPPEAKITLQELLKDWESFEINRPVKTVESFKAVVDEFLGIIGKKSAELITDQDILDYRSHLLHVVKNKSKTIDKKISFLSAIFNVAIQKKKLKLNPAYRIPSTKDDSIEVEPYEMDELKKIFGSELFSAGKRLGRSTGESIVWLPVLSLYQGAREEELGQLLVSDVRKIDGFWCLEITPTANENSDEKLSKKLKNRPSKRLLPLHPKVIETGFLKYVEHVEGMGKNRLFHTLNPDKYGRLTSGFSKAYLSYTRTKLGIENTRAKVFHSLRHNFRDACREADFSEELADRFMGHSDRGKQGRGYGRRKGTTFSLKKLHESICKIEYPGLEIPVLVEND